LEGQTGSIWTPFSNPFLQIFRLFSGLCFLTVFVRFGDAFSWHFASTSEQFLLFFQTLRKNAGTHEYAVPANEIKGPAPGKTIKKPPENEGKTARKRRRTKVAFRLQFGSILEGFLTPF